MLGVAFKRDGPDVRNSSALRLMGILVSQGADLQYHDPLVDELPLKDGARRSVKLASEALQEADCVVIHTDHSVFRWDTIVPHCRLILDTRNATQGVQSGRDAIVKL